MHALLLALFASQAAPPPSPTLPAVARDRAEAYYHFSLGLQARFSGDAQTSLEEYRKAARLDSGSAAIRVEMARLLREERKFDEAVAAAQEAVRLDPDLADAHLILAQLFQLRSESTPGDEGLKRAAAEYEQVVRLHPGDLNTLQTLAILYGQLREHKDAARVWQLYLALDPGSFEALLQLGSHQLAAGEPERAAASLKQALELQPDSARVYQLLGEIYAQAKQTDQAILHYRKALELDPDNVRVQLALGDDPVPVPAVPGGAGRRGVDPRDRRQEPLRPRPDGADPPRPARVRRGGRRGELRSCCRTRAT